MRDVRPRLLVIGSRGFLGGYAAQAAAAEYNVFHGNRVADDRPGEVAVDIRDRDSVDAAFAATRPDVVLLLAAMSDIDRCEQCADEAYSVNVHGAAHVAEACARRGARLLFTSSAAVFDGTVAGGYAEDARPNPVSVYGCTKSVAEELVMGLGKDAIVVRIALALGFASHPGTNALLNGLRARWASGEQVSLPVHEVRNPVDASTLSGVLLALLRQPGNHGVFHVGSSDAVSRYELGLRLAARMGFEGMVKPQTEPIPGRAPRGANHFLLTERLSAACGIPVPTCDEVIERSLHGVA
jgi:dTDP-4-dehydrorhamnose reductase